MSETTILNSAVEQAQGGSLSTLTPNITVNGFETENEPVPNVVLEDYTPIRTSTTSITTEQTFTINAQFHVTGADYFSVYPRLYEYNASSQKWYDISDGDTGVDPIPTGVYTGNNFTVDYEHSIIKTIPFYWAIADRETPILTRRMYCIRFDLYKLGVNTPFTFTFPYRFESNYVSLTRLLMNMNFNSTGKVVARFPNKDYTIQCGSKSKAGNLRTCDILTLLRFGIQYLYFDTGDGNGFVRTRIPLSHNFPTAKTSFDCCFLLDKCTPNRVSFICCIDQTTGASAITVDREIILYDTSSGTEIPLSDYGYGEDGVTKNTTGNVCGYYLYCTPSTTLVKGHTYVFRLKGKASAEGETQTITNHYSQSYVQYNTNCDIKYKP